MARNNARSTESSSAKSVEPPPPAPPAPEPAPAAEATPAPETPLASYLRRAVTTSFGSLRTAQSTALQSYAAWILKVEAITTKSLASAEAFLLGTFKLTA